MPKLFAAIVPPSLKAVSETFQFAPGQSSTAGGQQHARRVCDTIFW